MSTNFRLEKKVNFEELFSGKLTRFGICENIREDTTSDQYRCLTDGNNFLWVYGDELVLSLTRHFPNGNPGKILAAIADTFDTEIYSEYEPEYWGFETQEEWDKAMSASNEEYEAEFQQKIARYLRGETNDFEPGTVGMLQANIAKELVTEHPGLDSPDRIKELMENMYKVYEERHVNTIKLDDEDIAMIRMLATHEDNLPSA